MDSLVKSFRLYVENRLKFVEKLLQKKKERIQKLKEDILADPDTKEVDSINCSTSPAMLEGEKKLLIQTESGSTYILLTEGMPVYSGSYQVLLVHVFGNGTLDDSVLFQPIHDQVGNTDIPLKTGKRLGGLFEGGHSSRITSIHLIHDPKKALTPEKIRMWK